MKFALGPLSPKQLSSFPLVELRRNDWDDYGYRTTFQAKLHLEAGQTVELGSLKILHITQRRGETPMPEGAFGDLGPQYCSLAGRLDYYRTLYSLGPEIYGPYLAGIRDVVANPQTRQQFEDEEGYRVSLLRYSGVDSLIAEASSYFVPAPQIPQDHTVGFLISFKTQLGDGASVLCDLDFRRRDKLPNRAVALIGYNGTGKTNFLSNLAMATSGYGYKRAADMLQRAAGKFVGAPPPFKTVIVVSYSAFDTFAIPGQSASERASLEQGSAELGGYVYCGLREHVDDGEVYRLRTSQEIEDEYLEALRLIRMRDRMAHFKAMVEPLAAETSFKRAGLEPLFAYQAEPDLRGLFSNLSSGHKIVLKIVSAVAANIEDADPTLLLIDEPETHLHPSLLAALLKSLRIGLDLFNGYAVIATHSPIVLQEMPSRFVRVLRRTFQEGSMLTPSIETFGEDLGVITQEVFNFDDSATDWHDTLKGLAQQHSLEEIEALFERKLGFAARSYVFSLRNQDDN